MPQIAVVLGVALGFGFAPAVDRHHSPDRLTTWFVVEATLAVTFGAGLLLFQRTQKNAQAQRFLSGKTVAYVLLGCLTAVGVLPLEDGLYRYVFAFSVGAVAAVLATAALVGAKNVKDQRGAAAEEKKKTAEEERRAIEERRDVLAELQQAATNKRRG
jgi:peptidoglycan/LPS O-acetylase OafA/YrhL